MADIPRLNGVIRALESGKPAFTSFCQADPETALAMATSKYDGVVYEMEHNPWDIRALRDSLQYMLNRGQIARSGTSVICVGPVSLALGRLAAALGETDAALRHLEAAIETSRRIDAPPFTAYAQLALAGALRDAGQTEQADQALERCRTIARDLGMTRLLELVGEAKQRMS